MAKSIFKTALCSSAAIVLPAVPAAVFLPSQASAQTLCTELPGDLLECVDVDGVTTTVEGTLNPDTR